MPQDTISPRRGLLAKAQDAAHNSRAGRRLLGVTDFVNKFIGNPLENAGLPNTPGMMEAIIPAFESLVSKKLLSRAQNLFKEGGYFVDKPGDVYDLGSMFSPSNKHVYTHPELMQEAGLIDTAKMYNVSEDALPDEWFKALAENNLLRVRHTPNQIGLEMAHPPSNTQMEQIMALLEKNPKAGVGLDLRNLKHPLESEKGYKTTYSNADEALEILYNFFK
jgi:hypothetical protein